MNFFYENLNARSGSDPSLASCDSIILRILAETFAGVAPIGGSIHWWLVGKNAFINKHRAPRPIAKGFLSTLAASVNILGTNCTAFGTLATHVL